MSDNRELRVRKYMSIYATLPLELGAVRTYPLASRKSKVNVADFAKPAATNVSFAKFLDTLPNFLAAADLRELLAAMQRANSGKKAMLWGLGGHVIKVGLGPVLIDLMERGFVSGIAMNGAALIHDFEIAIAGNTSEDVDAGIGGGKFGMARETGEQLNQIAKDAAHSGIGYGEAAGQFLQSSASRAKFAGSSVVAAAYRRRIPVTVHLARTFRTCIQPPMGPHSARPPIMTSVFSARW
jgi:deoxyhypusine synthase